MRHGITIDRYDYSEPQSGEDVCDRIICPLKASIRKYCNEGHDIVAAQDMCTALNERPVKGTTATVCSIKEQFQTLEMNKIPDYSSLHNFEFSEGGLRVWKAFGVGPGKFISWTYIVPQGETNIVEEIPFFATNSRSIGAKERAKAGESDHKPYECSATNCTEEFDSQEDLDLHMNVYRHRTVPSQPLKESVFEKVKRDWVSHFLTITLQEQSSIREVTDQLLPRTSQLQMGWALHKKCGSARFSEKVRNYLTKRFNIGQETGRNEDPGQVAKDMKSAYTMDGERMFDRSEWLSKSQIQGFFSRLSASIKRGQQAIAEPSKKESSSTDTEDDDDDLIEEYACDVDEECLIAIRESVTAEISLIHPILYDVYDLCKLAKEEELLTFKVKMLREICQHFELPVKTRYKKADLVAKMMEMISNCSCFI